MASVLSAINDFLNSWRGVASIFGVVFLLLTRKAWEELVRRLSIYIKRKDLVLSTEPQVGVEESEGFAKIQETLSDLDINADREFKDFLGSVKNHLLQRNLNRHEVRELIHSIFTIKEQYEFAYLNLFLTENSKQALEALGALRAVTKEVFLDAIDLPLDMARPSYEREVIFNALLSHHLLSFDQGICRISEKGGRFLEFIG